MIWYFEKCIYLDIKSWGSADCFFCMYLCWSHHMIFDLTKVLQISVSGGAVLLKYFCLGKLHKILCRNLTLIHNYNIYSLDMFELRTRLLSLIILDFESGHVSVPVWLKQWCELTWYRGSNSESLRVLFGTPVVLTLFITFLSSSTLRLGRSLWLGLTGGT